jgi:hypothetical protein
MRVSVIVVVAMVGTMACSSSSPVRPAGEAGPDRAQNFPPDGASASDAATRDTASNTGSDLVSEDALDVASPDRGDGGADLAPDGPAETGADGARDAGDARPGFACGTTRCAGGTVCVRSQILGGACLLPGDAGCPPGYMAGAQCCVRDPSYACADRPVACAAALTCGCAAATLCSGGSVCMTPSPDEIDCTLLAP